MNRSLTFFELGLYVLGLTLQFILWVIAVLVLTVVALIAIWRGKSVDTFPLPPVR